MSTESDGLHESLLRGIADAAAGRIKRRDDWLADPNASGVSTISMFAVKWSTEDGEWVATCDLFPSLSWLAASPLEALDGLLRVIA